MRGLVFSVHSIGVVRLQGWGWLLDGKMLPVNMLYETPSGVKNQANCAAGIKKVALRNRPPRPHMVQTRHRPSALAR